MTCPAPALACAALAVVSSLSGCGGRDAGRARPAPTPSKTPSPDPRQAQVAAARAALAEWGADTRYVGVEGKDADPAFLEALRATGAVAPLSACPQRPTPPFSIVRCVAWLKVGPVQWRGPGSAEVSVDLGPPSMPRTYTLEAKPAGWAVSGSAMGPPE